MSWEQTGPVEVGDLHLYEHTDGSWTVADGGTWLPGIYDSQATAQHAASLTDAALAALAPIYRIDGQNRSVTMHDLTARDA